MLDFLSDMHKCASPPSPPSSCSQTPNALEQILGAHRGAEEGRGGRGGPAV